MATVGSIRVAFEADTASLASGIESVVSSLATVGDAIDSLSERFGGLASLTVSLAVDTSRVQRAAREVESLRSAAGGSSAAVSVEASVDGIEDIADAVDPVEAISEASADSEEELGALAAAIRQFAESAEDGFSRSRDSAVSGAESYTEARSAVLDLSSSTAAALGSISSSATAASNAVTGLSAAFASVTGGDNISQAADATITAAGRVYDAYDTVRSTISEVIPNATRVSVSAFSTLAGTLGGFSTIVAAAGGSAAAAAISVASLSAAVVSGATAIASYAGVMAAARFATAGMSEETQEYVQRAAALVATLAAGAVASTAGAAAFNLIATAIWSSGSASAAFTTVFSGVVSGLAAAAAPAAAIASVLGQVAATLNVVNAASSGSVASFTAAAAASLAFSAGLGAVQGAATAVATGASVVGGAVAGAAAGLASFTAALPATITLSVAAAVAFGRVDDQLRHVGQTMQMFEDMGDRFGATIQEMEKLNIAARNTGTSFTLVARAAQNFLTSSSKIKLGQINTDNVREAKLAYDQLGISLEDIKETDPQKLFEEVAEALSKVEDPAKRTQIAFDLFGKQGAMILPLLKNLKAIGEDVERLGGLISDIDADRFLQVNESFDRLTTATGALSDDLLIPFTRMQAAFNNAMADMAGGIAPLIGAIGGAIADITTPLAVIIEVFARVLNTVLQLTTAFAKLVLATQIFAVIAELAEQAGQVFLQVWEYVEALVGAFKRFAETVESAARPAVETFRSFSNAVADLVEWFTLPVFGEWSGSAKSLTAAITGLTAAFLVSAVGVNVWGIAMQTASGQAIAAAARAAAAWVVAISGAIIPVLAAGIVAIGAYVASVVAAAAAVIAANIAMAAAWVIGLGPIGWIAAAVVGVGVAIAGLWAAGGSIVEFFTSWGEGEEQINAVTASVDDLAEHIAEQQSREPGVVKDLEAMGRASGMTEEEITRNIEGMRQAVASLAGESVAEALFDAKPSNVDAIREAIGSARDRMEDLTIQAARFGQAGADAAAGASERFNELQKEFRKGGMSAEEFTRQADEIGDTLEENLKAFSEDSPEIALKKNIELFKQLDSSAKQAGKSARDIGAGVRIGDKFFPRTAEVKARAKQYSDEYAAALEAIKKRLASGGFQRELVQQRRQNDEDFAAGRITEDQFKARKLELDSTNAQEQASLAAEEVQRELDDKQLKLKMELDFADDIRRRLEDAFLTPVERFQKELEKIQVNSDLSPSEKSEAERMLRKDAREALVGKTAQEQLAERQRDLQQGAFVGLIDEGRLNAEMQKAADEFMSAVGIIKTPSEEFASNLNNITTQFGFAGQSADEVRKQLAGNADQLALFDRALKDSRDNLLKSLGVDKSPQQVFEEQMKKIDEAASRPVGDPGRITASEAERARNAARRARLSALGAGGDVAGQLADRRREIAEAFAGDRTPEGRARRGAALNQVAMDRRQAAGLDATASQSLQAGVDKINDAFGVTGKSMAEIQASLSPQDFKEYQEAIKQNSDSVKANLGVEKSGAERLAEARNKLQQAVQDNVITQDEANRAIKEQKDALLSSLGISKSPTQDFEAAVERIKENASALSPEELAKGLKETKDKLLSALGIDKSPSDAYEDAMENLVEASKKGAINLDEFAKGSQKARDTLLQSLGIPLDPVKQLAERMNDLKAAADADQITDEEFKRGQEEARRAMLPGSADESPVAIFKRQMEELDRARQSRLIGDEELADRRLAVQADLQESLRPALDKLAPDRRQVGAADARSKAGVDTFFRILQGRDNPSLKAQLEIARNTKVLAEAARDPEVRPIIAQLGR